MKLTSDRQQNSALRRVTTRSWLGVPDRDLTGFEAAMAEAGFTDAEDIEPWVESGIEYDTDLMVELAKRWRAERVPARAAVAWSEVLPTWSPARAQTWMSAGYEPQEAWFAALLIGMVKRVGRHSDIPVSSESQWLSSGLMPSQAALALAVGYATVEAARALASTLEGDRHMRADLELAAAMDGIHVREFRIESPRGASRDFDR